MLAGLAPSIGTVGDALDNALAETTIGLYKTECVREDSPFRNGPLETLADVEEITSAWIWWYSSCTAWAGGHQPKPRPSTTITTVPATRTRHTRNEACMKPGALHHSLRICELSFRRFWV